MNKSKSTISTNYIYNKKKQPIENLQEKNEKLIQKI
jgi:hypothetical protein